MAEFLAMEGLLNGEHHTLYALKYPIVKRSRANHSRTAA